MKPMQTIPVGAILACVLISFSAVRAQNLVQDPGFESSAYDPTYAFLYSPDWMFLNGENETAYVALGSSYAHTGNYAVGFGGGDILQPLATTPGVNYDISFYLYLPSSPILGDSFVGNVGGMIENTQNGPAISGGDNFLQITVNDTEQGNNAYTLYTASFTATSSNMNLIFSGSSQAGAEYLDDISVIAVPEPSSWVILLGSLALIGVLHLRLLPRRSGPLVIYEGRVVD